MSCFVVSCVPADSLVQCSTCTTAQMSKEVKLPVRQVDFDKIMIIVLLVFSCDQVALRTLLSACSSVCPSHIWQCSCHLIILKFSGIITIDRRDVHAKGQGQRSKIKVTEVIPFSRFRTVTDQFEFTYSNKMMHKAWCCSEEVPYSFSRSSVKFQGHTATSQLQINE